MKKLSTQCEQVVSFGKRVTFLENKVTQVSERNEKGIEQVKDYIKKTREMLENRVEQITQFDEKINNINESVSQVKWMNQEFAKRVSDDAFQQRQVLGIYQAQMNELKERTEKMLNDMEKTIKHQNTFIADSGETMKQFKEEFNNQLEHINMEMSFRTRRDELR